MNMKETLQSDLKDAMRSADDVKKRTIRMVLTNIKLQEVEKGNSLDEIGVIGVVQKEIKQREEAIHDATKANRPDLIKNNEAEVLVLKKYLPKQLSEDEIKQMAKAVIDEVQAKIQADTGKVMKALIPKVQGRAPNDQISQIVRQLLSN
jgi:uncharacterized protein YqeY